MLSDQNPRLRWHAGSAGTRHIPGMTGLRRCVTITALVVAMMVMRVSIGRDGGASLAAQIESRHSPHYKLVMSADDAVCKPLLNLYNRMLTDSIMALRLNSNAASAVSDFEVVEPERFAAIGFRLPPIEMGGGAAGVYRADVFNDGHSRPILMAISTNQPIMGAYVVILKRDIDRDLLAEVLQKAFDGSLTNTWLAQNSATDMDMNFLEWPLPQQYKKFYLPKGYLLVKWPHLDDLLERWVHRSPRSSPFLPIVNFATTSRVFTHENRTFFITNEYAPIRNLKISDGIVWIYEMSHEGPLDVCYLHMDPIG